MSVEQDKTKLIDESTLPPVYQNGLPYLIVEDEYVPYWKAKAKFQEKKIKEEENKLKGLKMKAEKEEKEHKQFFKGKTNKVSKYLLETITN